MPAPASPFTRRRKVGSVTRGGAAFLTEEQRLIIDNASEEQGASDQSIEKVIMISEDMINRSLEGGQIEDEEEGDGWEEEESKDHE